MRTSILTIDPGTRLWGVSVFHGRTFIISFVKQLSPKASPRNKLQEVRKIFLALFRKYAPDVLVIEKPYEFWEEQSQYLRRIIREIKRLASKEKIKVVEFSSKTARKLTCQNERATKEEIVQAIEQCYPELKGYLTESRKSKDRYQWGRLVDSIALGICYLKHRKKY